MSGMNCKLVPILFIVGMGLAEAGPQTEVVAPGDPHELVLRLDTGKGTFALYEPVILTYSLINPTNLVIRSKTRIHPEYRYIRFSIQPEGGQSTRYDSGPISDTLGVFETLLPPGGAMIENIDLYFNALTNELAFPSAGKYSITARIYVGNFPEPIYLEGGPVSIQVEEPKGADREVLNLLDSSGELVKLLRGGPSAYCKEGSSSACLERLRSIIRKYPDSGYVPSISLDLAYYFGYKRPGAGPQRGVQIEILEDFLRRWPEHPLAPYATGSLVEALQESGKVQESMEWIETFERKYPGRSSPRLLIEAWSKEH